MRQLKKVQRNETRAEGRRRILNENEHTRPFDLRRITRRPNASEVQQKSTREQKEGRVIRHKIADCGLQKEEKRREIIEQGKSTDELGDVRKKHVGEMHGNDDQGREVQIQRAPRPDNPRPSKKKGTKLVGEESSYMTEHHVIPFNMLRDFYKRMTTEDEKKVKPEWKEVIHSGLGSWEEVKAKELNNLGFLGGEEITRLVNYLVPGGDAQAGMGEMDGELKWAEVRAETLLRNWEERKMENGEGGITESEVEMEENSLEELIQRIRKIKEAWKDVEGADNTGPKAELQAEDRVKSWTEEVIKRYLYWLPANLVLGPPGEIRASDPGEKLDIEAAFAMPDGQRQLLLIAYNNMAWVLDKEDYGYGERKSRVLADKTISAKKKNRKLSKLSKNPWMRYIKSANLRASREVKKLVKEMREDHVKEDAVMGEEYYADEKSRMTEERESEINQKDADMKADAESKALWALTEVAKKYKTVREVKCVGDGESNEQKEPYWYKAEGKGKKVWKLKPRMGRVVPGDG